MSYSQRREIPVGAAVHAQAQSGVNLGQEKLVKSNRMLDVTVDRAIALRNRLHSIEGRLSSIRDRFLGYPPPQTAGNSESNPEKDTAGITHGILITLDEAHACVTVIEEILNAVETV